MEGIRPQPGEIPLPHGNNRPQGAPGTAGGTNRDSLVPGQAGSALIGSVEWGKEKGWLPQSSCSQPTGGPGAEGSRAQGSGEAEGASGQRILPADFWSQIAHMIPGPNDAARAQEAVLGLIGTETQEGAGQQTAQKAHKTEPAIPKLTKEGLVKMYEHNHEVLIQINEAAEELQKESPNPNLIGIRLESAKQKIQQRLKAIRIADRHGWQAVSIYEGATELGEDPEDSKKIKAAAAEAERQRKKAESLKRGPPKRTHQMAFQMAAFNGSGPGHWPFRTGGPSYPRQQYCGPRMPNFGACYLCGSVQHWARSCPQRASKRSTSYTAPKKED